MKHLLTLGLFVTATALSAQSFEWNDSPSAVAKAHPKEVVTATSDYDRAYNERQTGPAGIYAASEEGSTTAYGETYRSTEMTGSHAVLPLGTLLRVTNPANGRTVVVRVTDRGRECENCLITLSATAARELGIQGGNAVDLERSGFSNWNPLPPNAADRNLPVNSSPAVVRRQEAPASGIVAPRKQLPVTTTAPKPSVFTREVTAEAVAYMPEVQSPSPTVPGQQQARGGSAPIPVTTPPPVMTAGSYSVQLAAYNNEDYAQRRVSELKARGLTNVFFRAVTKEDGQVINRVYSGSYASVNEAQAAVRDLQGRFELAGIVAKM